MSAVRVGVDIGGTFTDVALSHPGGLSTAKVLTDYAAPEAAIVDGIARAAAAAGVALADISQVIHGTTLVTNALIQRRGARTALVTTEGFRDVIEMRSENRFEQYDLNLELPPPLVPRADRLTVAERVAADGSVLAPLEAAEIARTVARLAAGGYEAVAVGFLHSYANPAHERAMGAALAEALPGVAVSLSSEVSPRMRELARFNTTIANAYVQPLMADYLRRLVARLNAEGIAAPVVLMHSGGGLIGVDTAIAQPVRLLESGPAGGAIFAAGYARAHGLARALSFDMGGTTAKICLIEGGAPRRAHEFEAGRVRRFRKGSGIPLKITVVDMIEIGAGGGSLASVDTMGLLKVGPRSAGSVPGPVCYGRGGRTPAVTDADLKLGLLNAQYFLGGEMALAEDALDAAFETSLTGALGMDVRAVASGIHDVVNENMAAATRRYLAEKGRDPRRYSMVAFGGAGPLHAYGLARKLKLKRIVVPLGAGVTSALGFLVAPPAVDDVRSYVARLGSLDLERVNTLYAQMEANALDDLRAAGADPAQVQFTRSADMRHVGQGFEIPVPVPGGTLDTHAEQTLRSAFFDAYETLFERRVEDVPVETMSWRLQAQAPAPELSLNSGPRPDATVGPRGQRHLTLPGHDTVLADVYDRYALTPGTTFNGPAIIEERESTAVAGPDCRVCVDAHLNLIIDIEY